MNHVKGFPLVMLWYLLDLVYMEEGYYEQGRPVIYGGERIETILN